LSTQPHDPTASPSEPTESAELTGPTAPAPDPATAEDQLRRHLRDATTSVQPSAWPAQAVRARARTRRRNRRIAVAVPLAAVMAACAVVMSAEVRDRASGTPATPAVSQPAPDPTSPLTPLLPAEQVVPVGQAIAIGNGARMKLEPAKRCVDFGDGSWTCDDTTSANFQPGSISPPARSGSVSSQIRGDTDGTVYAPLYIGPEHPVRMTLAVGGHDLPVQAVTLPGHPGFTAGYAIGPPPPASGATPEFSVTAYDAQGDVLATVTVPGSTP
jgi:hypothetical protein